MKYYIEMTMIPCAEVPLYFLWQKVYQQLHLAFVEIKNDENQIPIGVSFPGYDEEKFQLGSNLRIFSPDQETLESLDHNRWLGRLRDYVHTTPIREIPKNVEGYALFKRRQVKSSITRIARRRAKKKGIDYDTALKELKELKFKEKHSRVPFINMKSQSSGEHYKLFIQKISEVNQPTSGNFSCYGLSNKTNVPIF